MEYFKSTGRLEQYTEYAYQLCERHLASSNHVEAGFTLLLQAEMLDWSDKIVAAIPSRGLAEETSYERKVRDIVCLVMFTAQQLISGATL